MIEFDFYWAEPLNLLVLTFAIALLPLQLWLLFRQPGKYISARRWLRVGLNVLLWLAVIALVTRPFLISGAKTVTGIIVGKDVPQQITKALMDSLINVEKTEAADLQERDFDTLLLAGQDHEPSLSPDIMQSRRLPDAIKWIPYFPADIPRNLKWRGLVRAGETQVLHGDIQSSERQTLKLTYGGKTLDSVALHAGFNHFKLQFPVFTLGRTSVELLLGNVVSSSLPFFSRPTEQMTVQFLLDNPDFESKALANWLGKSGHAVIYSATLSKNISSSLNINRAKDPDIIITGADNASNVFVKKALGAGKSVLFINMTKPATEIPSINKALGTHFQVQAATSEAFVTVQPDLTALPYRFAGSNRYGQTGKYPVAVERATGKIGISLLNETFPLQLSGDSVAYRNIWNAILATIRPPAKAHVEITAPIFRGLNSQIVFNNFPKPIELFQIGADTLFPQHSVLNARTAFATFKPTETGWIASTDSLGVEVFVEEQANDVNLGKVEKLRDFVSSYSKMRQKLSTGAAESSQGHNGVKRKLGEWMWFGLLMCCLLAVWIESKIR